VREFLADILAAAVTVATVFTLWALLAVAR
jgi:hypothetical protein